MGNIGNFRHVGLIIHNVYADDGFGGQTLSRQDKHSCYVSILSSNGHENFQNDAIFNIKALKILVRVVDSLNVKESDLIEIEGSEYNINNVELYEKDRNYNLLYVSKEVITGD